MKETVQSVRIHNAVLKSPLHLTPQDLSPMRSIKMQQSNYDRCESPNR